MTKARDLANVISGSGTLNANVIPALPASKITSGTIDNARISLDAAEIPALDASKITSGTFADARLASSNVTQHVDLSNLSASNLTSGTVPSARLSLAASDVPNLDTAKITSGTFADARLSSSSVTQHVDLTALDASNLTSGTIPNARYGTPTFSAANLTSIPAISSTPTTGSWTISTGGTNPSTCGSVKNVTGKYMKFGKYVHCQVSYQSDSMPSQYGSYRLALWFMQGLPFSSYNFGTSWFAGTGSFIYGARANGSKPAAVLIPSNSTRLYFQMPGFGGASITSNYAVPDSGPAYRQHDGHGFFDNPNKWGYLEFTYIANS